MMWFYVAQIIHVNVCVCLCVCVIDGRHFKHTCMHILYVFQSRPPPPTPKKNTNKYININRNWRILAARDWRIAYYPECVYVFSGLWQFHWLIVIILIPLPFCGEFLANVHRYLHQVAVNFLWYPGVYELNRGFPKWWDFQNQRFQDENDLIWLGWFGAPPF